MSRVVALVPLFEQSGPMGLADTRDAPFGDSTVLGHVLRRLSRVRRVDQIILIHGSKGVPSVPSDPALQKRLVLHEVARVDDPMHALRRSARKWSPTSWRGGLGGATCYDELLLPTVMADVAEALDASVVMLVGPDWPLVDPALCDAVIERHIEQTDRRIVLTQAPPGICGCLLAVSLLREMADTRSSIGSLIEYQPRAPQPDMIALDECVQVERSIRSAKLRFVFDAPRWQRLVRNVETSSGANGLIDLEAKSVIAMASAGNGQVHQAPQQVTLELTTNRIASGPVVPRPGVDRSPIAVDTARQLFKQLASEPDVVLTLGGLGDPLCHEGFGQIVQAARDAGLFGVHVQSDLLIEAEARPALVDLPIDILSVALNADTPEVYQQLMGVDRFSQVIDNIDWILKNRSDSGLPWLVPRLMKVAQNVEQLQSFFDRWVYFAGHAVIESPTTGGGLVHDAAVMDMAPPGRTPCRQIAHRMSVHSNGQPALCDQDWAGVGVAGAGSIAEAWRSIQAVLDQHTRGQPDKHELCRSCRQWHRP